MKPKIGLVIQGALMSIGRAGNNLHASPEQLKRDGGIIHYDSRDNINRTIKEFGHLFDEIVISVFDDQLKPGDHFPGAKIVSAPDPGGITQIGHYKDNNKYRQFISTLNGLLELEKSGVEYAVKARTDSWVDLDKLLKSFFSGIEKSPNEKAVYATVVHPRTFMLHDLYFASTLKAMKDFCEAIIAFDKFEFISSVHREMVLKHACVHYKKEIGVPESAYFPFSPPSGVSGNTRKIFDYMFGKVFFSLDPEIFRTTTWRGACYEKEHVDGLVERKEQTRKYNIPALISTDWERYFHFRKEVYGKSIGLGDKLVIMIGKCGWKSWNLLREAVNKVRNKS
jgi:hypothetical protein